MSERRLIDANALPVHQRTIHYNTGVFSQDYVLADDVKNAPTVDVSALAVHEKWIETKDGGVCAGCLNGLKAYKKIRHLISWCPFCGAKMDGGIE